MLKPVLLHKLDTDYSTYIQPLEYISNSLLKFEAGLAFWQIANRLTRFDQSITGNKYPYASV